MEKEKTTRDTYKKFSANEKARVAKRSAEYGVFLANVVAILIQ